MQQDLQFTIMINQATTWPRMKLITEPCLKRMAQDDKTKALDLSLRNSDII